MSSFLAFLARVETRASVFHFTVFLPVSVSAVYFAIWLSGRGISPEQIGIINAVPVLVLLLINLFIGRLADKAGDWRTMILIMALLAGSVPIGLFFVDEFRGILLVWTLVAVSSGSIPPVVDAATVLADAGLPVPPDSAAGPYLQLWPHRHGTDAMFVARFVRKA
jgi:PPP family 3-phenylpropionic acid transporter